MDPMEHALLSSLKGPDENPVRSYYNLPILEDILAKGPFSTKFVENIKEYIQGENSNNIVIPTLLLIPSAIIGVIILTTQISLILKIIVIMLLIVIVLVIPLWTKYRRQPKNK